MGLAQQYLAAPCYNGDICFFIAIPAFPLYWCDVKDRTKLALIAVETLPKEKIKGMALGDREQVPPFLLSLHYKRTTSW
jgi:hypothetical protein